MANRYFNKQTTNARQALAVGGSVGEKKDPRTMGRPKGKGRPSTLQMDAAPTNPRQPSPGPKGGPKRPLPRFKKKDTTDREKIISDKIRRNKIKDRLDKLKQKMKVGPVGTGLNPDKLKKSIKNLKDQMGGKKPESPERKKRQADYMKKHGKNAPRRKTLSVKNSYKKEVEGLK